MSLSRDSRQERKWKAFRRAEFQLQQRFQRIDWEEDVLIPEIEALKSGKAVAGLPAGTAFEIVIESPDANHPPSHADQTDRADAPADDR